MREALFFILVICCANNAHAQKDSTAKHKKITITGIPIINYNNSYGVIVGANGMAFFDIDKNDTISPASQVGIGGGYTQNKSWFGSMFTQLYLQENRWRITFAFGTSNINFQYFEAANESDEGQFVDYGNTNRYLFLKGLRKIKGHLYAGVFTKFQHSTTQFASHPDSTQNVNANGAGISFLFDSRNNIYHPTNGWFSSLNLLSNPEWLGSDSVFHSLRGFANYYWGINDHSIVAARISLYSGLGHVPFTGQQVVGGRDIRGYTNGKYRGNQVYALQAEYRWNFYKRWGAVGFAGMALTQQPSSGILPGGGAGIRFLAIPSRKINIGIDGALGKDDKGIYFRINEAF